ncbi:hypothetical protein [Nocardioides nanhaiensis]
MLLDLVERSDLERAVRVGDVVRDARGRYALTGADAAVRTAASLDGVVGMTDAALHHGWAVKVVPRVPHVVLSRGRESGGRQAVVHRAELQPEEIDGHWTSEERTLADCLRRLPFDEALCVADSARREGVGQAVLERLAERARGPGSRQVKRVAALCTPLAANPFESVARAIAFDVPGLDLRPQVVLEGLGHRADLVDEHLRLVVECDSFAWHGRRYALERDARRYNEMVVGGWVVLRLVHLDVMLHPQVVRSTLIGAVAHAELMNKGLAALRRAA